LKTIPRDGIKDTFLDEYSEEPSLFQRLFMCQCSKEKRTPARIQFQEGLQGLAGVLIQSGEHSTAGTMLTLKWMDYNPDTREGYLQVFGGYGGSASTGLWTENSATLYWYFLMNLARCANYQYYFTFNEDFSKADIAIKGNPLILCCICIPCCPAWFTLPTSCVSFGMSRTAGSKDGTSWERYSSTCGGESTYTYTLKTVYNSDGSDGPFVDALLESPEQVVITY
jgi:hypothetical protein